MPDAGGGGYVLRVFANIRRAAVFLILTYDYVQLFQRVFYIHRHEAVADLREVQTVIRLHNRLVFGSEKLAFCKVDTVKTVFCRVGAHEFYRLFDLSRIAAVGLCGLTVACGGVHRTIRAAGASALISPISVS